MAITISTQRSPRHAWVTRVELTDGTISVASDRARMLLAAHKALGDRTARAVVVEFNPGRTARDLTGFRGHVNYGSLRRVWGSSAMVSGIAYPSLSGPQAD